MFQQHLREYFKFGLGNAIRLLPFVLMDEEGLKEFQELFKKEYAPGGSYIKLKNLDRFKTALCDLVEDLVEFGFL